MPVGGKKRVSKKTSPKSSRKHSAKFSRSSKTSRRRSSSFNRSSRNQSNRSSDRKLVILSNTPKVVDESMSLTFLQRVARTRGIPFGGLNKPQLVRKINTY